MKKLLIFKDGFRSYTGNDRMFLSPGADDEPIEEIDLTEASDEEISEIKRNLSNDKVIKKFRSDIINKVTEIKKAGK